MFIVKRLAKIIFKRLTCRKHEYKQICKVFSTHKETGIEVIFDYDFECVKCGKRITIKMNKEYQLEGTTKRFTNR